jgi:hypothetical protein
MLPKWAKPEIDERGNMTVIRQDGTTSVRRTNSATR